MRQRMNVTVNGQTEAIEDASSVADLISRMGFKSQALAVEINGQLVPREKFDRRLEDGDRVEVVTLVGGG